MENSVVNMSVLFSRSQSVSLSPAYPEAIIAGSGVKKPQAEKALRHQHFIALTHILLFVTHSHCHLQFSELTFVSASKSLMP